jgi:hypothetical protein
MRIDTTDTAARLSSKIEARISKKANGALAYALLGIFGVSAIRLCPLAIIYAGQALQLIDQYAIGERYRSTAKLARIVAGAICLGYAGFGVYVLILALV